MSHSLRFFCRVATLFVALGTVGFSSSSEAAMKLLTVEPNVTVYSGPGEHYRILMVLPDKAELSASEEITSSRSGRFYRVVVRYDEKQKAIGFIPVNAPVRVGELEQDEDDLTKYGAVALFSKAFQATFGGYRDAQSMWTLGYLHYLSPGFYVKGFGGQWSTAVTTAFVAGGEIGNDALLVGAMSGFVSYGMGLFSPSGEGAVFAGSSKYNILMNATLGIRYNIDGFASLALAGSQIAFYNQNNSLVSTGLQASLEVGL
ncbi:MAG: hypothetical protein JNJ49_05905 [Bdellovibrionaceae bacterium]|nr:hypothetical protein [Pseudobdellovibrionaceae bacterium]